LEVGTDTPALDEFLLQHSSIKKLTKAPERDVKSLRHWHYNHSNVAIAPEEQTYLNKDDLVRVVHEDRTPLRRVIDSSLRLRTLPIWRLRKHEAPAYDAEYVSYYSDKRIDGFASTMIVTIGATMLIAPIWILQALNTLTMKLGVITIFILVFLLLISFAMVSKPFEALGATAAYAKLISPPADYSALLQRLIYLKICRSPHGIYSVWHGKGVTSSVFVFLR
jgi:hypothetical protein